jgi:hypothetical protein
LSLSLLSFPFSLPLSLTSLSEEVLSLSLSFPRSHSTAHNVNIVRISLSPHYRSLPPSPPNPFWL